MVNKKELGITSKLKAVPWGMFQMILLPAIFLSVTIMFCIALHFEKWYDYIIILVNACITLRLTYTLITGIKLRNPNTKTIQGVIKQYVDTYPVRGKMCKAAIIELINDDVVYYDFNGSYTPYPIGTEINLKMIGHFCMLV